MPAADPTAARGAAVVAAAFTDVHLDDLPDPTAAWWTTSVPEHHPGKRFHASPACKRLAKVKHRRRETRTCTDVGARACLDCLPAGSHDPDRGQGMATAAIRAAHADLVRAAAAVDAGAATKEAADVLDQLVVRIRGGVGRGYAPAADALAAAYNGLRELLAAAARDAHAEPLCRYATAMLLARKDTGPMARRGEFTAAPATATNLRLLDGHDKGGRWTAPGLDRAFGHFQAELKAGASPQQARAAAQSRLLPLRDPSNIRALPEQFAVPPGATHLSVAVMLGQWRDQATAVAHTVLDEWVTLLAQVQAEHADLGELIVTVHPGTGYTDLGGLDRELRPFATAFPARVESGSRARKLTVPVVIAAWLDRYATAVGATLTLHPVGANTAAVIETATRLRQQDPDLSLATALAAARGITAPAA